MLSIPSQIITKRMKTTLNGDYVNKHSQYQKASSY